MGEVAKYDNGQIAPAIYDRVLELASESKDLSILKEFMELRERHEANEARKAYHEAMAAFKANPPRIIKDRKVGYKAKDQWVGYYHASLANVTTTINSELSKFHLSAAWKTEQGDSLVTVTCTITHVLGHSESTSLSASPDNSGSKNSIQAIGSTITYLQRYTLLALTGLATHGEDDDGNAAGGLEYIGIDQQTEINDLITELYGTNQKLIDKCLAFMKIESVDKMPAKDYQKHLNGLKNLREGKR